MKDSVIKEIYKSVYQEIIAECNTVDALKMQEIENKFRNKVEMLAKKANSEETREVIEELLELHIEKDNLAKELAFVVGFKKGAQVMNTINE